MSEPTRARILQAAAALIDRDGIAGLSFRALARETGLSLGLAHHYFGTKSALLRALVDSSRRRFLRELELQPPVGDGPQVIRHVLQYTRALVDLMPGWYRLHASLDDLALRDPTFAPLAAACKREGAANVAHFLGHMARASGAPPPPPAMADLVLAALDGIALRRLLDPEFDLDAAHLALERLLLDHLMPPGPGPATAAAAAPWNPDVLGLRGAPTRAAPPPPDDGADP